MLFCFDFKWHIDRLSSFANNNVGSHNNVILTISIQIINAGWFVFQG